MHEAIAHTRRHVEHPPQPQSEQVQIASIRANDQKAHAAPQGTRSQHSSEDMPIPKGGEQQKIMEHKQAQDGVG